MATQKNESASEVRESIEAKGSEDDQDVDMDDADAADSAEIDVAVADRDADGDDDADADGEVDPDADHAGGKDAVQHGREGRDLLSLIESTSHYLCNFEEKYTCSKPLVGTHLDKRLTKSQQRRRAGRRLPAHPEQARDSRLLRRYQGAYCLQYGSGG